MQVGPCIPVGIHLKKADVGPTSGPTWRLSHCCAGCSRGLEPGIDFEAFWELGAANWMAPEPAPAPQPAPAPAPAPPPPQVAPPPKPAGRGGGPAPGLAGSGSWLSQDWLSQEQQRLKAQRKAQEAAAARPPQVATAPPPKPVRPVATGGRVPAAVWMDTSDKHQGFRCVSVISPYCIGVFLPARSLSRATATRVSQPELNQRSSAVEGSYAGSSRCFPHCGSPWRWTWAMIGVALRNLSPRPR